MPQLFQVLKCFKCSVFQVHQTKKSNKWECKLCGEKQSIKRHYGIGTGKECRLHVQKLNGIRGEVVEINEEAKLNESSDDDTDAAKSDLSVDNKRQTNNLKSKWSEFVDKMEDVKVIEPESMYIGNAEVVLEVPAKRRKFSKPKVAKNTTVKENTYPSAPNCFEPVQGSLETQIPNAITTNDQQIKVTSRETEFMESKIRAETKTFVPPKVVKNSKWAQYADESDGESYCCEENLSSPSCNDTNAIVTDVTHIQNNDLEICKDENTERNHNVNPKNIFTLCNEDDLDDVLDF